MISIDEHDPIAPKYEAPYLKLYSLATPNGQKVGIFLELLKPYIKKPIHVTTIDISKNTQKEPWFINLNFNGRIPTLSDVDADGNRTTISESGAILLYLADKYDIERKFSYPPGDPLYYDQLEWMFFQAAGLGPMQGQANHFRVFANEEVPYAIKRYVDETKRLYGVLELKLKKTGTGYLVGDKLTIVDIMCYPWVALHKKSTGESIQHLPSLSTWLERIAALKEIQIGAKVASRGSKPQ
ncbi:hypothetical protein DASC09_007790 [Saccharomycopsis crataegensis]|uniref:Glutathione S-transferase n=1 Tax=Saccharomycopsis crataegensis TaxID=43959 RepID=A0AAV5QFL2_9ASCO|nr:hypothetical protein DASC09_007790 [Saccharomycopsis crataegensis]